MRVALLSHNARAYDAVGNHVAETAAFFLERGAEVRLFVETADGLHADLARVVEVVANADVTGPAWRYLSQADLVVAQYAQWYALLDYLPLLAGGRPKVMVDYHGVTPPALGPAPIRPALEQSQRRRGVAWCADRVVVHSNYMRDELTAATGLSGERVRQLGPVVDSERFRGGQCDFLQRRLGLQDGRILLFVGRLAANKRVPLLVEAIARLRELAPPVHAVIVGDAGDVYRAEAQRCRELAERLGIADRVHLVGRLDEVELAEAYRSADVFVMPSRHEGFCVPAVEAMAAGLPVVAARATALPQTLGPAGLTFTPDDVADLARQVRRVLEPKPPAATATGPRRVAVVCFRFGAEIVGGAETSLRTVARSLKDAGHDVEVFTTCTRSESEWRNELPAGTTTSDGLPVHRFAIDAHDRDQHVESVRAVIEARGEVSSETEAAYLRHSIHSAALVEAIRRREDFDAIIVGPYLFGLTHDVARTFPDKTLLVPCFHDESLARLRAWPDAYGQAGGILLHSPEERDLMQSRLGINHPNSVEIGALIDMPPPQEKTPGGRRTLVYCGRYSREKNVPLLLEWAERYEQARPGRFHWVFMGRGEVRLPAAPWLTDLGRVDEGCKRQALADAGALVQLSRQESLSLVALEAWAERTPVIVHADCAVLAGQVRRSQGGAAVGDYDGFARALDDLWESPAPWRRRGEQGRAYVEEYYASRERFVGRLLEALDDLRVPEAELMRRRGAERAAEFDRPRWRERLGRIIEEVLDVPPPESGRAFDVVPLQPELRTAAGARTALCPVRVTNRGSVPAMPEGAAWAAIVADVEGTDAGSTTLPDLLAPGQTQTVVVVVRVPTNPGCYGVRLSVEVPYGERRVRLAAAELTLRVGTDSATPGFGPLLDGVDRALAQAQESRRLPDGYVDVTEGRLARWKRWVKRKLLNNFKSAYVDVLSRQQSHVNEQLVLAVQQLAECCRTLEHSTRQLQRRVDELEVEAAASDRAGEPAREPAGRKSE